MAASSQHAIALTAIGKPLEAITRPVPVPKPNEVLLKITAAGLVPLDMKYRNAGVFNIGSKLPAVLGCDVVGKVVSIGAEVTNVHVGQHVMAQSSMRDATSGGLQEYTVVDARAAVSIPKNFSAVEASCFPINAFTSGVSMFNPSGLGIPLPGSEESKGFDYHATKLLVVGGGTSCGQLAIQFARIAGIGCIVAIGGGDKAKALGATHVVDRTLSPGEIQKQVRLLLGDELLYVLDTFTNGDFSLPVSLLSNSKKGTYAHLSHGEVKDQAMLQGKQEGYRDSQTMGASSMFPEFSEVFWKTFVHWVESGEIEKMRISVIDGLDTQKVNGALDQMAGWSSSTGKWAVKL